MISKIIGLTMIGIIFAALFVGLAVTQGLEKMGIALAAVIIVVGWSSIATWLMTR